MGSIRFDNTTWLKFSFLTKTDCIGTYSNTDIMGHTVKPVYYRTYSKTGVLWDIQ